jgi:hypothetical protein
MTTQTTHESIRSQHSEMSDGLVHERVRAVVDTSNSTNIMEPSKSKMSFKKVRVSSKLQRFSGDSKNYSKPASVVKNPDLNLEKKIKKNKTKSYKEK